jgi:RNA polymerase sigma-70 factor (ECF subfamily)
MSTLAVTHALLAPDSEPIVTGEVDAGSAQRLEAIFDAHYDAIWRTVRRLGVPDAHADDAAQRVFVVAARRLHEIALGHEGRYLYGIAVRVASEIRRRDPGRRFVASGEEVLAMIPDDAAGPEESLLEDEARGALDDVLAAMPDDLREVLVLVELEGLTVAEIADTFGVPEGTAASRLRRAREAFTKSARRVRARIAGGHVEGGTR